jgi:hypothetical protein
VNWMEMADSRSPTEILSLLKLWSFVLRTMVLRGQKAETFCQDLWSLEACVSARSFGYENAAAFPAT